MEAEGPNCSLDRGRGRGRQGHRGECPIRVAGRAATRPISRSTVSSAPSGIEDHAGIENQWHAGGCSGSRGFRWRLDILVMLLRPMRRVLLTLLVGIDELPYSREMVIVVFRDKIQMVHESHRHPQTRVGNGSSK